MLIKVFNAVEGLVLVMEFARLWCPWIYLTSIISRCLYNWYKLITSTISYFFLIMPNFTKQLYKDFEFIYKIRGIVNLSIFLSITFMITLISNLYAISYCLATSILCIICLYFMKKLVYNICFASCISKVNNIVNLE